MYRVVTDDFRKANVFILRFSTEDGVCDPETSLFY